MKCKYLLDTCIWRDHYQNRFGPKGRPLGDYASKLIMKIMKNKDLLLFSEALVWELTKEYTKEEINNMLSFLFISGILFMINITKNEHKEAKKLSQKRNLPFVDCLNAIQARNHNAIMVSQDKHLLIIFQM